MKYMNDKYLFNTYKNKQLIIWLSFATDLNC